MTSLTAWLYDRIMGASDAEVWLRDLQERDALTVHDAITLTWFPGAEEPQIGHLRHRTTSAAAKGSLLGGLLGILVFNPVAGAAVGAASAAAVQRLRQAGIGDDVLERVVEHLAPGRSALLVLSSDGDPEAIAAAVQHGNPTLVYAELDDDIAEELRELLHTETTEPTDDGD
ncbi:DUF1269 domain-containing protein [Nocardioides albus]|uniref:Putative membrane protein n=1 Tax=Nocardioides albus TaxID=1841 RepID=A0A7W5FAF3_9ACTN|nr:DUF1269 domain-containing protein [Nocardioides albus]MBB3091091.1 putative membrane protein [Nocardioides albus]GGU34402.1 hypothetical protein GCM10007979_36940 [Nocardioides albus]